MTIRPDEGIIAPPEPESRFGTARGGSCSKPRTPRRLPSPLQRRAGSDGPGSPRGSPPGCRRRPRSGCPRWCAWSASPTGWRQGRRGGRRRAALGLLTRPPLRSLPQPPPPGRRSPGRDRRAVAMMTKQPLRTTVPPITGSPSPTSTGSDSPVIELRSTMDRPESTRPSVAIVSPARTTDRPPAVARPAFGSPSRRHRAGRPALAQRQPAPAAPSRLCASPGPRSISRRATRWSPPCHVEIDRTARPVEEQGDERWCPATAHMAATRTGSSQPEKSQAPSGPGGESNHRPRCSWRWAWQPSNLLRTRSWKWSLALPRSWAKVARPTAAARAGSRVEGRPANASSRSPERSTSARPASQASRLCSISDCGSSPPRGDFAHRRSKRVRPGGRAARWACVPPAGCGG